jgi:hypothetical protein
MVYPPKIPESNHRKSSKQILDGALSSTRSSGDGHRCQKKSPLHKLEKSLLNIDRRCRYWPKKPRQRHMLPGSEPIISSLYIAKDQDPARSMLTIPSP